MNVVSIYRNQSINFRCKSMDWFLYGKDLRHEKVKCKLGGHFMNKPPKCWKSNHVLHKHCKI